MTDQQKIIDSKALAAVIGEKITNTVKGGNNLQEIPNIIMDALTTQGIALPEKAKQAILEFQQKAVDESATKGE